MISLLYHSPRPLITYLLIGANGLVFIYQLLLSEAETAQFVYRYGLIPWELTSGEDLTQLYFRSGIGTETLDVTSPVPVWGTVFSSMFVHGGFMHIGLNMLFLWITGERTEARLGHTKFLLFYLVAGVAAVWAQVAVNPSSVIPLVGASGAISGIMGVYLVAFPRGQSTIFIVFWFISQLVNGLGSQTLAASGVGIAYMAHIGGFITGVLFALGYRLIAGKNWGIRRRQDQLYY